MAVPTPESRIAVRRAGIASALESLIVKCCAATEDGDGPTWAGAHATKTASAVTMMTQRLRPERATATGPLSLETAVGRAWAYPYADARGAPLLK